MIEFISHHPIAVPFTKTPNPKLLLSIIHKALERIKIENDVLETKLVTDRIVLVHKKTFLNVIGILENPKVFEFKNLHMKNFSPF